MSTSVAPTLRHLNDCSCCEGISGETPAKVENRPGLSAVLYRVGTHAQFKETMLARLSGSGQAVLRGLRTRDDDDFSVALLDAWATVADVLTFYQERIANESYLRTATERLSVLELARLIGHQPRPGVAASAYLAFTVEDPPGATRQTATSLGVPRRTTVDVGTKVQSVPGPGEQTQVFETVEKTEARAEWNAIRPRLAERHPLRRDAEILFLAGFATGLKKGDGLLITPDDGNEAIFRQVAEVTTNDKRQRTEVRLQPLPAALPVVDKIIATAVEAAFSPGLVTEKFLNKTVNAADFSATSLTEGFAAVDILDNLDAVKPPPPSVLALRTRAAIFGHNAPSWSALPNIQRFGEYVTKQDPDDTANTVWKFEPGLYSGDREQSWAEETLANYPDPNDEEPTDTTNFYLDNVYPSIVEGSWLALKDGNNARAYQVKATAEVSKSDFTLSAKVSRLTLDTRSGFENFSIRGTTVFGQSEELTLARWPIDTPVSSAEIDLNTFVDGLFDGQKIVVCGELDKVRGVNACELATIKTVDQVFELEGFTRLTLGASLENAYVRDTVTITANVALATHGETVQEILGSGDASRVFQNFTLRQPPLTYTSAATPSGGETTLEVRVNDLLWHEVSAFFGHGPEERIYVTHLGDDGNTTVMFGDGRTGARLPTGQENVKAKYRKGTGLGGLMKANQLSQLMTRPLGLKGVTNPLATAGAAGPETLMDARRNAPLTVLTLGRVVSLQDYEDFARSFAGVDKALATWVWNGERRGVFVTVAGAKGGAVTLGSEQDLLTALRQFGDPAVSLTVESYKPRLFRLSAALQVDSEYLPEKVLAEVEQRLRKSFSFEARAFGQPVSFSEVVAMMQSVPGVVAVDVNAFYGSDDTPDVKPRLEARMPRPGGDKIVAAELLTLDPRPLVLEVMP